MGRKVCAKSQSGGVGAPGNYLLTDGRKLGRGHERHDEKLKVLE